MVYDNANTVDVDRNVLSLEVHALRISVARSLYKALVIFDWAPFCANGWIPADYCSYIVFSMATSYYTVKWRI